MEERLRFDGQLNLSQANLPEGDYSDARNMVVSEGPEGNAGAFKKMASIEEFTELPPTATDTVAASIDEDGNQYLVFTATVNLVNLNITGVTGTILGDEVTQTASSASGYVYSGGEDMDGVSSYPIQLVNYGGINFVNFIPLVTNIGSATVNSTTIESSDVDIVSIIKVTPAGDTEMIVAYKDEGGITIADPDIKILDQILVWNYLGDGIPMSWITTRGFRYMSTTLADSGTTGWETSDLYLVKKPPIRLYKHTETNSGLGTEFIFQENAHDIVARFVYDTGEVSVVSSPVHIPADADGTKDNLTIEIDGTIPNGVTQVEFYASRNRGPYRRVITNEITDANPELVVFSGQENETLSTRESSRFFDAVPISAQTLEINSNRVFMANLVDDLDGEDGEVSVSVTLNVFADDFTGATASASTEAAPFSYLPSGANNTVTDWTEKHLTNDSLYKIGVVFLDEYHRNRGVNTASITDVRTGGFGLATKIEELTITSSTVPSWAKYAKVVMTDNLSKDYSIEAYANSIFFQLEDDDGTLYFSNVAPEGVRVNAIVIDAPISYSFQEGDRVNLLGDDGVSYQTGVNAVINGLIYCDEIEELKISKIDPEENYIEIFSPRASNDDSLLLFRDVGRIFDVSSGVTLNETFRDSDDLTFGQKHYDQYFEAQEYRPPLFNTHIDTDDEYYIEGSLGDTGDPISQPGLPIPVLGSALVMNEDSASLSGVPAPSWWDTFHSNYHLNLFADVNLNTTAAHGFSEGNIEDVPGGTPGTDLQRIINIIDTDDYYATEENGYFTVASSTGFSQGDFLTITNSALDEDPTGYVLRTTATRIYITGLSMYEVLLDSSTWTNVSNGTTSEAITSATISSTGQNVYSEEKMYVVEGSAPMSGIPGNTIDEEVVYNYLGVNVANGIILPAKEGKAMVYYDISVNVSIHDDDVIISLTNTPEGASLSTTPVGTCDGTGDFRFSGVTEFDLLGNNQIIVRITAGSSIPNPSTFTIKKGSYLIAVDEDDLIQNSLRTERSTDFGLCRKPNRIENNAFYWDKPSGRPILSDNNIAPKTLETKIRYGARLVEDSIFNPISSFNSGDQDFVSEESGPITALITTNKIDSIGSVLLAICERETNSIYVGERLVTNNDGSSSLAISDAVIGSIQPLQGSHGSKHKRSIAKDQNGNVAWWDDYNRDIVRYSREGLVAISDYKVKPFFQDTSGSVITMYDKFHDMYFFHIVSSGETISFKQGFGWVGFHDFSFDLGGVQFNDRAYPINNNTIYETLGSTYGVYMGSAEDSTIKVSKFAQQNFEPKFLRVRGELTDGATYTVDPITFVLTNDMGQQTTMTEGFFVIDGSYIYTDVYLDENSGGITDGLPLNASNLDVEITLGSENTTPQAVKELYLGFETLSY